jgi:hypothetical protein
MMNGRGTEILGENLPQCRFVHRKPHMFRPDANPDRRGGKLTINRLSYDTAFFQWKMWVIPTMMLDFVTWASFYGTK